MKVVFLDSDGVLNCKETFERRGNTLYGIDPALVELALHIQRETGCGFVLSSTWRLTEEGFKEVEKHVDLIGKTSDLPTGSRGREVELWLAENKEVTRYAILDDSADFRDHQPLFQTNWNYGLTKGIAEAVIRHLNAPAMPDRTSGCLIGFFPRGHQTWKGIKCLDCGMVSFHAEDMKHRFCGKCHKFHPPVIYT